MPFDGIVTLEVNHELQDILIGGKINKIHQPTTTEMIISVLNASKHHSWLLAVRQSDARRHVTKEKTKHPAAAPMLSMDMRDHLFGAVTTDIKQNDREPIIAVPINARNEMGVMTEETL